MFDYLDKFNKLSSDLKTAVSSSDIVTNIDKLEKKYNIDLAPLIMKIMIKEININNLPLILFTEFNLSKEKINSLKEELKNDVFYQVLDYLGLEDKKEKTKIKLKEKEIEMNDSLKSFANVDIKKGKSKILEKKDLASLDKSNFLESKQRNEHNDKIKDNCKEIIKILNFKFIDQGHKNKFVSNLDKYLRGVKSRYDTREIFTRNKDSGGFSLADKMVDNIFMISQEMKKKEDQIIKNNIQVEDNVLFNINKLNHGNLLSRKESLMLPVENFSYKLALPDIELLPSPDRELSEGSKDLPTIISKNKKLLINKSKSENLKKKEILEKNNEIKPIFKNEKNISKNNPNISFDRNGKVQMADVKRVKISGPIDELRYMSLTNFRRLSADPVEIFKKIAQKLKVLEEIDYSKMLEGIKAWRQSPVNKLYLKMFFKASNEVISLDQVIEKLKLAGEDYLSKEELEALISFNKGLVF